MGGDARVKIIAIPFQNDMATLIIQGRKTATTRNKRYGIEGDCFLVASDKKAVTCRLLAVRHLILEQVAFQWWREEGFHSVEGFINKWEELHPRKGYIWNQKVWVHQFEVG